MVSRRRRFFAAGWRAVLGALLVAPPGCATHALERAPAHREQAWTVPPDSDYAPALREAAQRQPPATAPADEKKADAARENRVRIDTVHQYTLPELIDIAQRFHPETRDAWEKARQAALAVGIAEAAYLPELTAKVVGGYQRTPLPMPTSVLPSGVLTFITAEAIPMLAVKWLLFDLSREAAVHEAKAKSVIANITFTAAHETVIFGVSRDYFALDAARAALRVAEHAAKNAERTQEISEARRTQGVGTVVEVAQAARQTAQARFDVVKAQGAEHTAYSTLVASMGVDPNGPLQVADSSDRPLPAASMPDVRALVEVALANRPDVVAALGKVRAAEAGLQTAHAGYWPTLELTGQLYENIGWWDVGSGFSRVTAPGANILLGIGWPIFNGGAREAKTEVAHSEVSAARAALDGVRDKAAQEVTSAYDKLQTSYAEYKAAVDVEQSAQTALDAAVEAYRAGVGLLTDALSAEDAARKAQLQKESARGSIFTSAAALAFALGSATRR